MRRSPSQYYRRQIRAIASRCRVVKEMLNSKIYAIAGLLLAVSTSPFCLAGLCEENSDICELVTGCYSDRDCEGECVCNRGWWAFKPVGSLACPQEGCPLYVWIDGTEEESYQRDRSQLYMLEMLKRGFIAANVEYQHWLHHYAGGCEGNTRVQGYTFGFQGLNHKTQEIFDSTIDDSVVTQLCDGPDAIANCDLGIATHGHSQGANIASLAGNYDNRVSASLLFSNGNDNPLAGYMPCLNNENLSLPRERRRSIAGENDGYFGLTRSGVLLQQTETSGYDCGDRLNCFAKLPEGCAYGEDEQYCEAQQRLYAPSCPACNNVTDEPCPSDLDLFDSACPVQVPDTYLGGDALIESTGGYYIITDEEYCAYTGCDATWDAGHNFFQDYAPGSDFLNPEIKWGLPQNLDWLDRIARKSRPAVQPNEIPVTQDLSDLLIPSPTISPTASPTTSQPKPTFSVLMGRLPPVLQQMIVELAPPPTSSPIKAPSDNPTYAPTSIPTDIPTDSPSYNSTLPLSYSPADGSTSSPTKLPTDNSNTSQVGIPTPSPKLRTSSPTRSPDKSPSNKPTDKELV